MPGRPAYERLNRILWGTIKGWNIPYPGARRSVFSPLAVGVELMRIDAAAKSDGLAPFSEAGLDASTYLSLGTATPLPSRRRWKKR